MPYNEAFDIDSNVSEETLDEIDAIAAKAERAAIDKDRESRLKDEIKTHETSLKQTASDEKRKNRRERAEAAKAVKEVKAQKREADAALADEIDLQQSIQDLIDTDRNDSAKILKADNKNREAEVRIQNKDAADARKAQESIEKKQYALRQKAIAAQTRKDERTEKKMEKLILKMRLKELSETDDRTFLQKVLGGAISSNPRVALSFFKNPVSAIQSLLTVIPILGGIIQAKQLADFVWRELVRIDAYTKKFTDAADRRITVFRDRHQDANIKAGLTQTISTTQSGIIDPRDSYNSLDEHNTDGTSLENYFTTFNTSGVD